MAENLDAVDWSILIELQGDGRLPITELSRRVKLSASATSERVRRLEATGVISGYRAEVDLAKAGFAVLAVVRLKYPGSRPPPTWSTAPPCPIAARACRRPARDRGTNAPRG
ncbi:Lrp/AsnC family transcriptional regulator [Micromonospora sp. DT62]|uniref:Lrp/AsnC family transcriptional regulator n=1 Tax=Micromonospora sp. DT62 TaxID=3416521 RepID=UPI003CF43843